MQGAEGNSKTVTSVLHVLGALGYPGTRVPGYSGTFELQGAGAWYAFHYQLSGTRRISITISVTIHTPGSRFLADSRGLCRTAGRPQ
eukprot:1558585-Rhodomonas_salina.1